MLCTLVYIYIYIWDCPVICFSGVCEKISILGNVFLAARGPANLAAVGWLVGLLVGWLAGPGLAGSLLAGVRARWSYSYLMAGLLADREAGWARPLFFFSGVWPCLVNGYS